MEFWFPVAIGLFVIGCFTAFVANAKHHDSGLWFVLGVLFGPIALLAIGLVPAMTRERIEEEEDRSLDQTLAEQFGRLRSVFRKLHSERLRQRFLNHLRTLLAELEE